MVQKLSAWLCVSLAALACNDTTVAPDPRNVPSLEKGGVGRPVVLVNPNVHGNGTATTIQEGITDPWSVPESLGIPVNTSAADQNPSLSANDRTLVFASTRPGGTGGFDLWMTTRTSIP